MRFFISIQWLTCDNFVFSCPGRNLGSFPSKNSSHANLFPVRNLNCNNHAMLAVQHFILRTVVFYDFSMPYYSRFCILVLTDNLVYVS